MGASQEEIKKREKAAISAINHLLENRVTDDLDLSMIQIDTSYLVEKVDGSEDLSAYFVYIYAGNYNRNVSFVTTLSFKIPDFFVIIIY